MSFSRPFFSTSTPRRSVPSKPLVSEEEYKQLHWTVQLELRPLKDRKRWINTVEIDFDNRLDNWEEPEGEQ